MRFDQEPIAVIGCGKEKVAHRARAEDLYVGPLFKLRLELARQHASVIYIASGLHGLMPSDRIIAPYEYKLEHAPKCTRDSWGRQIADDLRLILHASSGPILGLVSGLYASWIPIIRQDHHKVVTVGDGLPVGKLRAALAREIASGRKSNERAAEEVDQRSREGDHGVGGVEGMESPGAL